MNLKLTEHIEKNPQNTWTISVSWMSGDADAYETEKYSFETREEFEACIALFQKIFKFKEKYHNLFCDVRTDRIQEKYKHIVDEQLLGEAEGFRELFEPLQIEPNHDVTYEGAYASPERIVNMFYYDENGKKFKVEIEQTP